MTYILPDVESVELLHETVLAFSAGKAGIHDYKLIESAVKRPASYVHYVDDYDIDTICALLIDSLARYHGFKDGNKRTALMTAVYTYKLNDVHFMASKKMNQDFDALVMRVVTKKPEIEEIRQRLRELRGLYAGKEQSWYEIFRAFVSAKISHDN
jgi:death-on-curing family protein